ncbi:transmembrane protein DUF3566 [Rhodococcus sp. AG1013]|uniref:DUF3566 domain-containing protein n=1 Tax=Rhodococcus sp. AG1013 TaxID=2183996 RepID=UPI000E09F2FC|nr:DUF3566 domain-containing protein [Rhodococcus sp. AG1013]RDI30589.1 transmembrane protein DUF3566 [Rhodococcus sp. AG1013]
MSTPQQPGDGKKDGKPDETPGKPASGSADANPAAGSAESAAPAQGSAPAQGPGPQKPPVQKPAEQKAPVQKPAEQKAPVQKPAEQKAPEQKRPGQTPPWQRGQQQQQRVPQTNLSRPGPVPGQGAPGQGAPGQVGGPKPPVGPAKPSTNGKAAPSAPAKSTRPVVTGTAAPKPPAQPQAQPPAGPSRPARPVVTGTAAPKPPTSSPAAPGGPQGGAGGPEAGQTAKAAAKAAAKSKAAVIDGPTRSIARTDLAKDMPDLSAVKHPVPAGAPAAAGSARKAAAAALTVSTPAEGEGLRATVQVRRVDPWSMLKVSLVISVALFFVWMVAVGLLYVVLDGMGVWDRLNSAFTEIVTDTGSGGLVTSGQVFGYSALIGLINVVLITAIATIGSFIYNLCSDLVGGVQVTLADPD